MSDPTFVPPRPYLRTTHGCVRLCATVTEGLHNHCILSQNRRVTVVGPDPARDGGGAGSLLPGFEAADLDEARERCEQYFYPMVLEPVGSLHRFAMSFRAAQIGAVTVGVVHYGADLRVTANDLVTGYNVALPLSGQMVSTHRNVTVTAAGDRAVLYQPVGPSRVDPLRADCRLLSIKIERGALEQQLEEALGRTISGPLALAPSMDITRGPGRSWVQLAGQLTADAIDGNGVTSSRSVADRLAESLITGLLVAADHPYREELTRPELSWRPRPLRSAVDAMRADPARPFTVVELAGLAGVSVRALQSIFHRHTGLGPMAYLRELRLDRVHEELRRADPGHTTVAMVAHRWGFSHLGRFAAAYRERYGVPPSATLRMS
jgi:AraC-like DNA-binding protein